MASAVSPSCAGGTCTVTYASPGTGQSFTIPAGVTGLVLTLYGAMGGRSEAGDVAGGAGTVDDTGNSGQVNGGNGEAVISYASPAATGTASAASPGPQLASNLATATVTTAKAAS